MQELSNNQFHMRKKTLRPTIILSVVCAACIIIIRALPFGSVIPLFGISFAYSDIFILWAAGIGGLGGGLLTFVLVLIGDVIRLGGQYSDLYALSTYMILVFLMARFAYAGWLRGWFKGTIFILLLTTVLAGCWFFTFTVLLSDPGSDNMFQNRGFYKLFLGALPECILAVAGGNAFFRYAPDEWKMNLGSGWAYVDAENQGGNGKQTLGVRMTILSLFEALLLCLAAMLCSSLFAAADLEKEFSLGFFLSRWYTNLRMGLLMLNVAIPIAYLFNLFAMKYVVHPINAMSFLMERYFDMEEKSRLSTLPELDIHTGDEVEKLYHSLQKMVADMALYLEQMLMQEKKSAHMTKGFMLALAKAVDAKDRYTSGHSTRVAQYSREIAKRMGKTEKEQEDIFIMGLLHDIGKIGVPEAIINKNGRLTDEEFGIIKEHPVMGYEILKNVEELPELATGARWHHERYDGRGYPDGLSGEQIPEEARIIAVADAYDAMTSNRAYSNIRPQEEVRAEIERCKGTQFDPVIAEYLIQMIDEDKEYRMHE